MRFQRRQTLLVGAAGVNSIQQILSNLWQRPSGPFLHSWVVVAEVSNAANLPCRSADAAIAQRPASHSSRDLPRTLLWSRGVPNECSESFSRHGHLNGRGVDQNGS